MNDATKCTRTASIMATNTSEIIVRRLKWWALHAQDPESGDSKKEHQAWKRYAWTAEDDAGIPDDAALDELRPVMLASCRKRKRGDA